MTTSLTALKEARAKAPNATCSCRMCDVLRAVDTLLAESPSEPVGDVKEALRLLDLIDGATGVDCVDKAARQAKALLQSLPVSVQHPATVETNGETLALYQVGQIEGNGIEFSIGDVIVGPQGERWEVGPRTEDHWLRGCMDCGCALYKPTREPQVVEWVLEFKNGVPFVPIASEFGPESRNKRFQVRAEEIL